MAPFKPALIVVDFQQDFCPPNGSLAVPQGRDIADPVNKLLQLPFHLKIATRDWHPPNHVSFARNHAHAEPYVSSTTIVHPADGARSYQSTLWPVHCVQGTPGAELVPELDGTMIHRVFDKGIDPRVEMYSALYDPFRLSDSGLVAALREEQVTDVFVVGLAADYCVRATAEDVAAEKFRTLVVEEATRAVKPDQWPACRQGLLEKGVQVVSLDGDDVARVRALA